MIRIEHLDDPRIAPYKNLRDRTLRGESLFIAEGALLTKRLLAGPYEAESIFVIDEYYDEFRPLTPENVPIYVAPEPLLLEIVGFPFHRGAMAIGKRPPVALLENFLDRWQKQPSLKIVLCPEITKPENMGLIFRTAAGFGLDAVILDQRCCDPFSRRALRLSMGAVFNIPLLHSPHLQADMIRMKESLSMEFFATVLDAEAENLRDVHWPERSGILFGNEMDGLASDWLNLCDRRVTIPMARDVDSFNLGVAAGIFLYEMMKTRDQGAGGQECR